MKKHQITARALFGNCAGQRTHGQGVAWRDSKSLPVRREGTVPGSVVVLRALQPERACHLLIRH